MTSGALLSRHAFREQCLERDDGDCLVPWCSNPADEVHHIIERSLWDDEGYYMKNGASVCNKHHQYAEENYIPPQAFWRWIEAETIPAPLSNGDARFISVDESDGRLDTDKWGKPFDTPPHEDLRDFHKYPSSRHLLPLYWEDDESLASSRTDNDDTGLTTVESFIDCPLVITEKMDGGNAMLVKDQDEPVRARRGREAVHQSFDLFKQLYWEKNVYEKLPEHLQVFGEWLYAKHSIHYGCDCNETCDDPAPSLSEFVSDQSYKPDRAAYFQVFGVFDTRYNLWLSWPEVESVADFLDFPTAPVVTMSDAGDEPIFEREDEFERDVLETAKEVVSNGNEGLVVRCKFPFHYGQFGRRLGKYVREGHVVDGETHWKHRQQKQNRL